MSETSGVVEFLLARIAEDEGDARAAAMHGTYPSANWWNEGSWWLEGVEMLCVGKGESGADVAAYTYDERDRTHIARHDPARVLAECEAKRRIVELRATTAYHVEQFAHAAPDDPFRVVYTTSLSTYDAVLRSLIMPYADHPDYDPTWT